MITSSAQEMSAEVTQSGFQKSFLNEQTQAACLPLVVCLSSSTWDVDIISEKIGLSYDQKKRHMYGMCNRKK